MLYQRGGLSDLQKIELGFAFQGGTRKWSRCFSWMQGSVSTEVYRLLYGIWHQSHLTSPLFMRHSFSLDRNQHIVCIPQ